jgi:hypothetical protein
MKQEALQALISQLPYPGSFNLLLAMVINYNPAWYATLGASDKLIVDGILPQLVAIAAMPPTQNYALFPWSTAPQEDYIQAVTDPDGEAYVRSNLP